MENREELFNELDVNELEDRLELVSRCLCRNGGDGGDNNSGDNSGNGGDGGEGTITVPIGGGGSAGGGGGGIGGEDPFLEPLPDQDGFGELF